MRHVNSVRGKCLPNACFYLPVFVAIGCVLVCGPIAQAGDIKSYPLMDASGFFSYSGTTGLLTLAGKNAPDITTVTQITYGTMPNPIPPYIPPTVSIVAKRTGTDNQADLLVDSTDATVAQFSGVTYSGSGFSFSNGTFTLTLGYKVVFSADIVNVALSPTGTDTANINPGGVTSSVINLQNVVVNQPSAGTSRFVTDWLSVTGGSKRGSLGLTLTNTDTGDLNPLTAPASGPALLKLYPAIPEPAGVLLMLAAGGYVICGRRRKERAIM